MDPRRIPKRGRERMVLRLGDKEEGAEADT